MAVAWEQACVRAVSIPLATHVWRGPWRGLRRRECRWLLLLQPLGHLEPGACEDLLTLDVDANVAHAALLCQADLAHPVALRRCDLVGEHRLRDVHAPADLDFLQEEEHARVVVHALRALLLVVAFRLRRLQV